MYGGGGGGATLDTSFPGKGGSGIGGNAAVYNAVTANANAATAGATSTGSGGGAGRTGVAGAAGGSGTIVLSIPTAFWTNTYTGTATVTTLTNQTIIQFTGNGTYTA